MAKEVKIKKVTLVFVILEILDIITTIIGIRYFGYSEINPLARVLGLNGLFVLKVVVIIFIAVFMQVKNLKWVNVVVIGIISLPVIWNSIKIVSVLVE